MLYEYAIILHPETDEDGKEKGDQQLMVEPTYVLSDDDQTVAMEATIEHADSLRGVKDKSRVEILVRPFG